MVKILDGLFGGSCEKPSRRGVLKGMGALVGVGALAACSVSTKNGVTTISLNVAEIDRYAQAALNGEKMIMSVAPISGFITPALGNVITDDVTALTGVIHDFDVATNGLLTIDYDNSNWKTRVDSVLNAMSKLDSDLTAVLKSVDGKISTAFTTDANVVLEALNTAIAFFKTELGYLGAVKDVKMSKEQAFKILGVKTSL